MEEDPFYLVFLIFIYGSPILLALGGFVIGGILENRHYESIHKRETEFIRYPAVPTRSLDQSREVIRSELVTASVVVSLDYFKRILASFRNIFGGRVRSYESLLDRAKREAILRLKEQYPDSDIIVNLRISTSQISRTKGRKKGLGAVEVLAIGTAVQYQ